MRVTTPPGSARIWVGWAILCGFVLAGCRTNPNQQLFVQTLREQEDQIYHLKFKLEDYQSLLENYRRQTIALQKRQAELEAELENGGTDRPSRPTDPPEPGRFPDIEGPPEVEAPPLVPPLIQPPDEDVPEAGSDLLPPPQEEQEDKGTRFRRVNPSRIQQASVAREVAASRKITDWRVARVNLNSRLTGGWDADGKSGHEGVMLLLELRNAEDQVLRLPAEVSVAVFDPKLPPNQRLVDRWDLHPNDIEGAYKQTLFGPGILLQLPWLGERPENSQLRLQVNVTAPDGRDFQVEQPIRIEAPLRFLPIALPHERIPAPPLRQRPGPTMPRPLPASGPAMPIPAPNSGPPSDFYGPPPQPTSGPQFPGADPCPGCSSSWYPTEE